MLNTTRAHPEKNSDYTSQLSPVPPDRRCEERSNRYTCKSMFKMLSEPHSRKQLLPVPSRVAYCDLFFRKQQKNFSRLPASYKQVIINFFQYPTIHLRHAFTQLHPDYALHSYPLLLLLPLPLIPPAINYEPSTMN